MEYNKKAGILLMVTAPVVAIISFLSSDCYLCNISEMSVLDKVMYGYRFRLFQDDGYPITYFIDIATKHILFICLAAFALGLLYYLEVFNAPRKQSANQVTNTADK